MTKRVKWGVTAAILLLIVGMIVYPQIKTQLTASGKADEVAPAPGTSLRKQVLNINAEVLKFQSLTDKVISTGSIIPDEEVDLSFESSGKVVNIYFTEGTHVKAGDLLAKINDKPLQAQLRKLEAQIPLAKDRVYRQRTLLEKDAVSQEAYEQVTTEYEKLMADIDLVKANILQTELRAPFDGIIGLRSENRILHSGKLCDRRNRRHFHRLPPGRLQRHDARLQRKSICRGKQSGYVDPYPESACHLPQHQRVDLPRTLYLGGDHQTRNKRRIGYPERSADPRNGKECSLPV